MSQSSQLSTYIQDTKKWREERHEIEVKTEPLLDNKNKRDSLYPIVWEGMWNFYKLHLASHWVAQEIDLSKDVNDWNSLKPDEQHYIKYGLAFFAGSDFIINESQKKDAEDIKIFEYQFFNDDKIARENIHCVSGDTKILTDEGYVKIEDKVGKKVNIWNGDEFSSVDIKQTTEKAQLYRVVLSDGRYLDCTDEHKWIIQNGDPRRNKFNRVMTKDLKLNSDRIFKYDFPVIDGKDNSFLYPYTHGFFCGDGSYITSIQGNVYPILQIYSDDKKDLIAYMDFRTVNENKNLNRLDLYLHHDMAEKYTVPFNFGLKTKLKWLEGYVDADGCIKRSKNGAKSIQMVSINRDFISDVQMLISTMGVNTNLKKIRDECDIVIKGKKAHTQTLYCLYLSCNGVESLKNLGFNPKRLNVFTTYKPRRKCEEFATIDLIVQLNQGPTYCFNEPKNHMGIFNGILTGQSTTYADLLEQYVDDTREKETLKNAVKTMPSIATKAEWMREYIQNGTFVERLVAEAIMEGIFFSGTFCGIFWLRKRGLMPALCDANEFISRDEGIHRDFNCYVYRELIKNKLPEDLLTHMIRRAVTIEQVFVTESLPVKLIGMNSDMMCQYIQYVADHLCYNLIQKKIYNVENPFDDWMNAIALKVKADFFVHRPTAYGKSAVLANNKNDIQIRFNDMSF